MAKIFGLAFVFELIMAFNLAMFLTGSPEAAAQMNAGRGGVWVFNRFWLDIFCLGRKHPV